MIPHVKEAISKLRKTGYKGHVFIYFLARDLEESSERIREMIAFDEKINPFVMPYRNLDGNGEIEDQKLKLLARWCNMQSIRTTVPFEH